MKDDLTQLDSDTRVFLSSLTRDVLSDPSQERSEELKLIATNVKKLQEGEKAKDCGGLSGKARSIKPTFDHDGKLRY